MEALFQVVTSLLLLVGLGALGFELWAYQRVAPWYVRWLPFEADAAEGMIHAIDPASVRGREDHANVRYRWDPDREVLLFGRRFRVQGGEWGHAVGSVRFGEGGPRVSWRPAMLGFEPLFFLFGCFGALGLVLVEGEMGGLLVIPALVPMLAFIAAIRWYNARGTLRRVLLPELAEALGEAGNA